MRKIIVFSIILILLNLADLFTTYINMTYNGAGEANPISYNLIEKSWWLYGLIKLLIPAITGGLLILVVCMKKELYKFSLFSLIGLNLLYITPILWNIGGLLYYRYLR